MLSKACNFLKKKLQHKCFPVNIAKFLRANFFIDDDDDDDDDAADDDDNQTKLNTFQPSASFQIGTSHLIWNEILD